MMRALIDTNVLLDVLLARVQFVHEAEAIWQAQLDREFEGFVAAISISNIFYVARKIIGVEKARAAVKLILDDWTVTPIDRHILQAALQLNTLDFEDAIQITSAQHTDLDCIVTRDPNDFHNSSLPIYSPAKFLELLNKNKLINDE